MHVVVARHDELARRIDTVGRRVGHGLSARGHLDDAPVFYPDDDVGGGTAVTGIDDGATVEKQSAVMRCRLRHAPAVLCG
jgi:hypothetical protein